MLSTAVIDTSPYIIHTTSSWDDPRFPTVRGVLRRGLTVATLKKYVLLQGPSRNNMLLEWDKLWSMNKQEIDQVAPRFVGLAKEGLRQVLLVDAPAAPYEKQMPKHKKNPAVGMKTTTFTKTIHIEGEDAKDLTVGEEITMMDFGNIIITKVPASADAPIEATLNLAGDFKKTKKKLTWLPDLGAKLVPLKLRDYDFLITKKKLEEEDTFEDCLNEKTEFLTEAVGDANLVTVKKGEIIQLERRYVAVCLWVLCSHPDYDAHTDSKVATSFVTSLTLLPTRGWNSSPFRTAVRPQSRSSRQRRPPVAERWYKGEGQGRNNAIHKLTDNDE